MNRKLPLNQKLAIHGKIMAKNGNFHEIFDIFQRLQEALGFYKHYTKKSFLSEMVQKGPEGLWLISLAS